MAFHGGDKHIELFQKVRASRSIASSVACVCSSCARACKNSFCFVFLTSFRVAFLVFKVVISVSSSVLVRLSSYWLVCSSDSANKEILSRVSTVVAQKTNTNGWQDASNNLIVFQHQPGFLIICLEVKGCLDCPREGHLLKSEHPPGARQPSRQHLCPLCFFSLVLWASLLGIVNWVSQYSCNSCEQKEKEKSPSSSLSS